jgi:hypothetical protein
MSKRLGLIPLVLLVAGCGDDMCADTVIKTALSPDGRRKAVLFERNCGATTGFSTQVGIYRANRTPASKRTVFTADTDHGAVEVAASGGPWADLAWASPNRLVVTYAAGARVHRREPRAGAVTVVYRSKGAGPSPAVR